MTGWMMRVRDADLGIRTIGLLARELECDDARDIRLKRQNLQVEHELRVVGERRGDAYRPLEVGYLVVRYALLGALDFPFDLTNAVEILIQARSIGSTHALLEPREVTCERIQQAGSIAQPGEAFGRTAAIAEQPLENDARMRFGRKRGRRRRP